MGLANRAIATFNGVLSALRNPEILLSPLTTQEAVLSSKIEGTQATLDEVLEFEAGEAPQRCAISAVVAGQEDFGAKHADEQRSNIGEIGTDLTSGRSVVRSRDRPPSELAAADAQQSPSASS